jgi:amidase
VADFRKDFQAYLDDLEFAPIKSLQELIDFNREYADGELPPGALLSIGHSQSTTVISN